MNRHIILISLGKFAIQKKKKYQRYVITEIIIKNVDKCTRVQNTRKRTCLTIDCFRQMYWMFSELTESHSQYIGCFWFSFFFSVLKYPTISDRHHTYTTYVLTQQHLNSLNTSSFMCASLVRGLVRFDSFSFAVTDWFFWVWFVYIACTHIHNVFIAELKTLMFHLILCYW